MQSYKVIIECTSLSALYTLLTLSASSGELACSFLFTLFGIFSVLRKTFLMSCWVCTFLLGFGAEGQWRWQRGETLLVVRGAAGERCWGLDWCERPPELDLGVWTEVCTWFTERCSEFTWLSAWAWLTSVWALSWSLSWVLSWALSWSKGFPLKSWLGIKGSEGGEDCIEDSIEDCKCKCLDGFLLEDEVNTKITITWATF